MALSSIVRRNRMNSCLHIGESPQSSSFQLPGCCSFCCRMTLELQILIKHGIKRASFHRACHRTHPRNAFPMGLARSSTVWYMVHVCRNGAFSYAFQRAISSRIPARRCQRPPKVVASLSVSHAPSGQQSPTLSSQTHHLFSSRLLPNVPDTVLMPINGHIAVNRHLQVGFDHRSSHLFYVPDLESMPHLASFQLESHNSRKIFACS